MTSGASDPAIAVQREVSRVLESELLARAPSQSRILAFLGQVASTGSGGTSQYAIAVDALGKSHQFDESTDSSVRVQIGRLRKSLLDYYRLHQPGDGQCLYIRSGEYRLRLGPLHIAYPELARPVAESSAPTPEHAGVSADPPVFLADNSSAQTGTAAPAQQAGPPGRRRWIYAALAVLVLALGVILVWQLRSGTASPDAPVLLAPPVIQSELRIVNNLRNRLDAEGLVDTIEGDIDMLLQKSMMSRSSVGEGGGKDRYRLLVSLTPGLDESASIFTSLRDGDGNLIAENLRPVAPEENLRAAVNDEVVGMVAPAGPLGVFLAERLASGPRSAFECFVAIENHRSEGKYVLPPLERCEERFGDSEYGAYFAARGIARSVQMLRAQGREVERDSREWERISAVLAREPEDPVANAVAAKMLIGVGACREAEAFATRGFSRGKTYPALELSVIVDAYGCEQARDLRPFWDGRIERLARINADRRSPLLEALVLLSAILADKEDLVRQSGRGQFSAEGFSELGQFNRALDSYIAGTLTEAQFNMIEAALPRLIWNDETVAAIEAKLERQLAR
ncbi:hypothetical protein [Parerythrobacter lacustris]|uniref:OmpR/PhoB-type domain-containing protein n=1 Tax=Parerythrobacter lacustris TaxID=2969984 RepID=A0ABT1XLC2_9SPHN|nr:hypothetical protein [Parerythrobacter lacustris]MCR2832466.1 hypothetical protein [Parerythrobacter lacustris]